VKHIVTSGRRESCSLPFRLTRVVNILTAAYRLRLDRISQYWLRYLMKGK